MTGRSLIAGLFALAACVGPGGPDRDTGYRVDFTGPACDFGPIGDEMGCDFVSEEGRYRRILLGFIVFEEPEAAAELEPMSVAEKTLWFQRHVRRIDARRETVMPEGYRRISYRILPPSRTPPGFQACAKSREELPAMTGERGDGAHLHCWGPGPDGTGFAQLLFSYIEYNDPGTPVSASFERDADAVLSTVRVVSR